MSASPLLSSREILYSFCRPCEISGLIEEVDPLSASSKASRRAPLPAHPLARAHERNAHIPHKIH